MSNHDGFPNWNPAPGGGWYKDVDVSVDGVPGVEHVYQNGHTEFVPNPAPVTVVSSTPQPTTPSPAPVAPAPASPPTAGPTGGTPAPAPTPSPTPVSSTPQPTTGGTPAIPPAPAWNPADTTVYENPTTHDLYQVDDASTNGQWHVYQTHAEWVSPPAGESGWDITNLTPAQYAAEQGGNPPPTVVGSTPQPTTGGMGPSNPNPTGGTAAPSGPTVVATPLVSSPVPPQAGNPGDPGGADTVATTGSGVVAVNSDPTGGTAAPQAEGASYTVVHGDTMWGIAQSNNISLSQLEALNPQIKDPDLIFPGQTVNLGSGSTDPASSPVASSSPAASVGGTAAPASGQSTTPVSASGGASQSIDSNSDSGASNTIGFPGKSSYPSIGSEVDKVADDIETEAKAQGWGNGSDSGTSDIAKGPFEADSHTSTDPLKIEDKK